jgi:hypothetical protein
LHRVRAHRCRHPTRRPGNEQGFEKVSARKNPIYVVYQSLIERAAQTMSKESKK